MTRLLLTSLFLLDPCGWTQNSTGPAVSKTISVCELFEKLTSYRGKIVAVRGIYSYGLRQNNCREKFVTGGHEWPTAISLIESNFSREDEAAVPFTTDHESWDALEGLDLSLSRRRPRPDIWVTIIGQLRARKEYVLKNGDVLAGYGHLGVYPAELVVKTVTDVVVVPRGKQRGKQGQ